MAVDLFSAFTPQIEDARHRARVIKPKAYASTRNFLDGAVTRISPYITHGFLSLADLAAEIEMNYPADECEKLIMEFGWREFFQHVWRHQGERILRDLKPGLTGVKYASDLPPDIVEARTGIPVIDQAVRTLYATGYLHNHARMWLASYVVHLRKVHWRAAAGWMYGYLLDGDPASNHLSWQWVAATFSSKPYVFNAENVARHAPAWASPKTAIDISYEELDDLARGPQAVKPEWRCELLPSCEVPPLLAQPASDNASVTTLKAAPVLEFDTWLIHPWDLGEHHMANTTMKKIGIIHQPFHAQLPWSQQRWDFVLTRMRAITDEIFVGDLNHLLQANPSIQLHATETYHFGYREALSSPQVTLAPVRRFTKDPEKLCPSFSRFWAAVGREKLEKKWHK